MWTSTLGWEPGTDILGPLPAAIFLYFWTFFAGVMLHNLTKFIIPGPLKEYVLDFVKTMTLCSYPFGHGIMRKFYGEPGYMSAMVPIVMITLLVLRDGAGNPIDVWIGFLNRKIPLWKCIIKSALQMIAGFSAYHLGMLVISVEFSPVYVEKMKEYYSEFCESDLNVPVYLGFLIEFVAVIYDTWFSLQLLLKNRFLDMLIKVINGGLLVVAGVHLTGMYIHPAMATGHTWGCGTTPKSAHILIYWVGPFVGAWLALQVNKKFQVNLYTQQGEKKVKLSEVNHVKMDNGPIHNNNNNTVKKRKNKRKFYYN